MLCCQAESELLGQSSSPNSAFQARAQVCVILLATRDLSLRRCHLVSKVAGAFTCEQKQQTRPVSLGCEGMGYFSFTLFCILQLHIVNLYAAMHDHTNTHYMHTCTLISGLQDIMKSLSCLQKIMSHYLYKQSIFRNSEIFKNFPGIIQPRK